MIRHLRRFLILIIFLLVLPTLAQQETEFRIGQLDTSQFPTIRFNLFSADSRRVPLSINELQNMSLREAGVPIANYELTAVPIGIDITFILDTNGDYRAVDLSGETREQVAVATINRFAERVMSPSGLDRVSIIVTDTANQAPRFLIQDNTNPQSVSQAITSFNPAADAPVPLNDMMAAAIEHLATIQENGRFQAILLLSDAGRINGQLNYEELTTQAQTIDLPLYVAILGTEASSDEVGNAAALTEPTRADTIHIPAAAAIDPIYLIWQRQANQIQVTYRSHLTASGSYPISVNVGPLLANTTLNLTLEPPQVAIQLDSDTIIRRGDTPDTPLEDLQPSLVTIPVIVRWPDDLPRQITEVNWFIDGQPQPLPTLPEFDENGRLQLNWSIRTTDISSHQHQVQVVDELGLIGDSDPLTIQIDVQRPLPPTPTPLSEATATPPPATAPPATLPPATLILLAVTGLTALTLLLLRRARRRRQPNRQPRPKRRRQKDEATTTPSRSPAAPLTFLEIIDAQPGTIARIPIHGDNITIGRDQSVAQVILNDSSVSRLHARIRRRDNTYWLYDEGSTSGTSLNYERLGLAPRQLNNNDTIQIGRIALRFGLTTLNKQEEEM